MRGLVSFTRYNDRRISINVERIIKMEVDSGFADRTLIYLANGSPDPDVELVKGELEVVEKYIQAYAWKGQG